MVNFADTVPSDLSEAVDLIVEHAPIPKLEDYKSVKDFTAAVHHGLGRHLRNAWSLWDNKTAGISGWFRGKGILHADDKSGIILKAYYCRVLVKPFELEKEIEYYREFWRNQGIDPDTLEKTVQ